MNSHNGIVAMASASALMSGILRKKAHLSAEEKQRIEQEHETAGLERVRQARIIRNICPSCEGKLIRGKKDKRNDYKRVWKCSSCHEFHSM